MNYLEKYSEMKKVKFEHGQKNIVEQLERLVNDSSMNVIGLEGEWGSGKSSILKALEEKNQNKYCCYEYDLWAHQEDNIRYSFLRGLLEKFKFKIEGKDYEAKVEELIGAKKKIDEPKINYKMAGVIFTMLLLPIFSNIAEVLWKDNPLVYVVANIFFPIAIVSLLYLSNNKKIKRKQNLLLYIVIITLGLVSIIDIAHGFGLQDLSWLKDSKWTDLRYVFANFFNIHVNWISFIVLLFQAVCLFFIWRFLSKMLKNYSNYADSPFVKDALSLYSEKMVETSYSTTVLPRMEDVQFFLKDFFSDLLKVKSTDSPQIIIIFDNLDRLPSNKIRDFWTFLQTFFVEKNYDSVTTIVAFERGSVEKAWDDGVGAAYLEKSLDLTIYIPLLSRMDLKNIFKDLWQQAFKGFCNENGENSFVLYHLLKRGEKDFPSLRGIIDAINEVISVKEKIDVFFPEKKVQGRIAGEKVYIEYPIELAAMYVFRKKSINKMFSDTVKTGIVQYYIDAFDDYRDWVAQYVPEVDDDGKKMCLQRIYNRIIQNNNESANNMNSYYIIDFFYKGRLEYFFNGFDDNDELKDDFEYIFATAIQRIDDNGIDILNAIKSLLYCQKGKVCSARNLKIKWGLLFKKMELLNVWPKEAWFWNALLYYGKDYLKEFIWPNGAIIADSRENSLIDKLKDYYVKGKKGSLNGKICLNDCHLKGGRTRGSYKKHKDPIGDGNLFFYENRGDENSIMKDQLEQFTKEDWEKSLENFWNPGVIQYDNLTDEYKSKCKLDNFDEAVKHFFENYMYVKEHRSYQEQLDLIHFDDFYRWGPLDKDEYYEKWRWIIRRLEKEDFDRIFNVMNRSIYFSEEMVKIINEIGVERGIW